MPLRGSQPREGAVSSRSGDADAASGSIHADVCAKCHPFYTGKQKILDTGGRIARFQARYGKKDAAKTETVKTDAT